MARARNHHQISYIEFATPDIQKAKDFYVKAFNWSFQDWGPDYTSFRAYEAGLSGGFRRSEPGQTAGAAAPLIVLYSTDLKATEAAIVASGGTITVPTFDFPGGRRFHFNDGVGNTLAVWSE
jgi:hypothetical protein